MIYRPIKTGSVCVSYENAIVKGHGNKQNWNDIANINDKLMLATPSVQ